MQAVAVPLSALTSAAGVWLGFAPHAHVTHPGKLAAALPVAALDPTALNVMVGIIVANSVLAIGQILDLIAKAYERIRKVDETSERGGRIRAETRVKELEAEKVQLDTEYRNRLQNQIATSNVINVDQERRTKQLEENVAFVTEHNKAIREDSLLLKDMLEKERCRANDAERRADAAERRAEEAERRGGARAERAEAHLSEAMKKIPDPVHTTEATPAPQPAVENRIEIHTTGEPTVNTEPSSTPHTGE